MSRSQEFPQLRPLKRRGNRRYYQKHDLLLVRQIRFLLYGEGFTIHGARERIGQGVRDNDHSPQLVLDIEVQDDAGERSPQHWRQRLQTLRHELEALRNLCVRRD
nr:MerR family transcriptional regulator [Acidithiobacillus sp. AMEEHan]